MGLGKGQLVDTFGIVEKGSIVKIVGKVKQHRPAVWNNQHSFFVLRMFINIITPGKSCDATC